MLPLPKMRRSTVTAIINKGIDGFGFLQYLGVGSFWLGAPFFSSNFERKPKKAGRQHYGIRLALNLRQANVQLGSVGKSCMAFRARLESSPRG